MKKMKAFAFLLLVAIFLSPCGEIMQPWNY